ncbi:MAG TPA: hypothetical protein VN873_05535 [Candidatus Angelobacter sp.]|nr:hypothetical protein [Candidatus Angelobacter sp.]
MTKAPSANIQAPEQIQAPSSKTGLRWWLGVWSLKFGVSLELGRLVLGAFPLELFEHELH